MKKILSVTLLISVLSLAACGTNDATVTKNEVKTPNAKVDNN
jgi:predicted small lipoprotein YifL